MAVSNATPKVQFTGNNSTTEFAFNFVVPASLDTGLINDSTAVINQGTTSLTVSTADLFYTSDLQGKTITIAGAGAGSSTLTTTIVTVNSATNVTIADAASVTVNNAAIVVTTGQTGTTLKNNNEIEVFVDSTQQTITTDYTVRLNVGDDINKQGTVIFTSPPATSTTVTIARNIELSRTSDFQAGGALTAKELNAQFDNVVMAVQDQKNDDDRFIQFPPDEPTSTSGVLPDANTRAGKFFTFDTNGDIAVSNTVNLPNASLIVSSLAVGSGDITTLNTTTGTITNLTTNNIDISGGLIDSTSIGSNTPSTGAFTTLTASGTATFPAVNINGGTIDGATIGADSPANGTFANVTINGTLTNTGGDFVLGSIIATGSDGIRTKKIRSETTNELSIESQSNKDISITTDGIGKLNLKSSNILINPTGSTSTSVGGRTGTGNIITSDKDLFFNTYNSPGNGIITFISNDGISIDGTNPKVKGLLQLQLQDGNENNEIKLTNSADADNPGIEISPHANTNVKLNQLNFPPVFPHHETGAIDVGKHLKLKYKKTVTFGLSGQTFTYPSADVGDKLVKSGATDNAGIVLFPVTGSTGTSAQYVVLTDKQTWDTSGPYQISDENAQTYQFTSTHGTPSIMQSNDTGYHVGYQSFSDELLGSTTDGLPEGSSNLYYTDARVVFKLNQSSINELQDVVKGTPTDGQVLTFEASSGQFKPATPTTAPVTSVNSLTGAVSLGTDEVAEGGSNLYFTNARFDTRFLTRTTDNLAEGSSNLYFTNERVDDQVATLLTEGTGISLSYNDSAGTLTITNTNVGLTDIVNDTTPQLGGGLDVNGNNIFSTSNADIKIQPHGSGATLVGADNTNAEISTNGTGDLLLRTNGSTTTAAANSSQIKINDGTDGDIEITPHGDGQIDLDSYVWPKNGLGGTGQFLKINSVAGGVAQLSWASGTGAGLNNLVDDTTPQLGGDLDTQANALSGTDIIPSTGSNGGFNSGGSAVRLLSSGVTTHDHAIRTAADSGRQNISFIMDSTGSFSASQTSSGGSKSGSGLIYSPLNMQVRDRGESTKTRTTFDIGVPYIGNTGETLTSSGSATGRIFDVVDDSSNSTFEVYLMQTTGTWTVGHTTTGKIDGTITGVDTSIGTNAVKLTYASFTNNCNGTTDLASMGLARFSARDVLNTRGIRSSEPELHFEAGRIAFESNGTKVIDCQDDGGVDITTTSNQDINILPNGTGKVNLQRAVIDNADGLMVRGPDYADISLHRRESTSHATYSLEVQHDHGSDGFSAGDPAGAFGMAAYADSTNDTGNSSYIYVGQINGVIGDGDSLSSATGADINNGVRAYVYQNGISGSGGGFDVLNAATFRSTNADFMQEKLTFSESSNNITFGTTSNGDLIFDPNGTGAIKVDASIKPTASQTSVPVVDTSANTITVANGASIDFANSSGVVFINEQSTSGDTAVFVMGGGQTNVLQTASNFSTSSSSGNFRFYRTGDNYRFENQCGSTITISVQHYKMRGSV